MSDQPDIVVHLPREYLSALSEVIFSGLQRANIDPKVRRELRDWWTAEKTLIEDEIENE